MPLTDFCDGNSVFASKINQTKALMVEQPRVTTLDEQIKQLQVSYMAYMTALKAVLDFGDNNIPFLIAALNHKHANPIAKALGLMMYSPAAAAAIPPLLDWIVVQSPLYPDVFEAVVRAGNRALPFILDRLHQSISDDDDEAVRNLLDVATKSPDPATQEVSKIALQLLGHGNSDMREAAALALARIGLPHARPALEALREILAHDKVAHVRQAALDALTRLENGPEHIAESSG
jgi:hypothetical protein